MEGKGAGDSGTTGERAGGEDAHLRKPLGLRPATCTRDPLPRPRPLGGSGVAGRDLYSQLPPGSRGRLAERARSCCGHPLEMPPPPRPTVNASSLGHLAPWRPLHPCPVLGSVSGGLTHPHNTLYPPNATALGHGGARGTAAAQTVGSHTHRMAGERQADEVEPRPRPMASLPASPAAGLGSHPPHPPPRPPSLTPRPSPDLPPPA